MAGNGKMYRKNLPKAKSKILLNEPQQTELLKHIKENNSCAPTSANQIAQSQSNNQETTSQFQHEMLRAPKTSKKGKYKRKVKRKHQSTKENGRTSGQSQVKYSVMEAVMMMSSSVRVSVHQSLL